MAIHGGCGERRSGADGRGVGRSGAASRAVVAAVGRAEEPGPYDDA